MREPDGIAAAQGKEVHHQLEQWSLHATMPTHKVALAGLPYAPAPGAPGVHIEREIRLRVAGTLFRGFIDVGVDVPGRALIQDWKTTTKKDNMKAAEYLKGEDIQANLYAYESFARGFAEVHGRWVYLLTTGPAKALPVSFQFEKQKTVDLVEGPINTHARQLLQLYKDKPEWTQLEKRTGHCYAYSRQCHVFDTCKPNRKISLLGADMSADFRSSIAANFPGALPPPPPAGALPPPPPSTGHWVPGSPMNAAQEMLAGMGQPLWVVSQAADVPPPVPVAMTWPGAMSPAGALPPPPPPPATLPPTDRGFVNPPEAPATPSPSPEAAAARQGILPPTADVPDDLTGLTRDQLKAMAVTLGAVPENTHARAAALREAIRSVRAGGPTVQAAPQFAASLVVPPETAIEIAASSAADAYLTGGQITDLPPAFPGYLPGRCPPTPAELKGTVLQEQTDSFKLYVNCAPDHSTTPWAQVLEAAHEVLRREAPELKDYRQIQFTALADLNIALKTAIEEGTLAGASVIVDATRPDVAAVLTTLEGAAATITRGF